MDRVTALELQRATFARKLHGVDPAQVRELLDRVSLQLEGDTRERGELRAEIIRLDHELADARTKLASVQAMLDAAREEAEALRRTAEVDAERLLAETQGLADRIIDEASRRAESIDLVVGQLRARRRAARADLKRMAELLQGVIEEDSFSEGRDLDTRPLKVLRPRHDRTAER